MQRQLVADVPLGAFLSDGVDSSLVVAAMQRARTFSIAFGDQSYNEAPYARAVADHLDVDHVCEAISADVVGLFEHLMYLLDDPIGDFSIFPTFLVLQVARKHVTVALSGDGGDELFGGYETYLAEERARQYARVPAFLREKLIEPGVRGQRPRAAKKGLINKAKRFVEGFHHPEVLGHARWRLFVTEEMRAEIFTPEAGQAMATPVTHHITELMRAAGPRQPLNRGLYVDVKSYLCDNILTKVDRMSMGVSLEVRVPYLGRELVELAFQVPDHLKVSRGRTKVLLKAIAARHVPAHCVYRPKEGFSVPIKNWLCTQFRDLLESLVCRQRMQQGGIFARRSNGSRRSISTAAPITVISYGRSWSLKRGASAGSKGICPQWKTPPGWRRSAESCRGDCTRSRRGVAGPLRPHYHRGRDPWGDAALGGRAARSQVTARRTRRLWRRDQLPEPQDRPRGPTLSPGPGSAALLRIGAGAPMRTFPELVTPLPCLMPVYGEGLRRRGVLGAALCANDLLSLHRNRGVGLDPGSLRVD